jgi:hypothetical protein
VLAIRLRSQTSFQEKLLLIVVKMRSELPPAISNFPMRQTTRFEADAKTKKAPEGAFSSFCNRRLRGKCQRSD